MASLKPLWIGPGKRACVENVRLVGLSGGRVVSQFPFACLRYVLFGNLTAGRPVKDAPHGKFFRNLLDLVFDSRCHEQEVASLKRIPPAVVEEHSTTPNDKVNLALGVRRLLPRVRREERAISRGPRRKTTAACSPAGPGMPAWASAEG